jgi:FG-GAP repeat
MTAMSTLYLLLSIPPALLQGTPPAPILERHGSSAAGRFGAAIAGVGDLDADGRDDLLVGEPRALIAGQRRGRALVYSGADGSVLFAIHGGAERSRFGQAVAGGGDVDGDGTPDFAVGAPMGSGAAGSVTVFSGANGKRLFSVSGEATGDEFGSAAALVGDVDGDGHADLLVGAPKSDAAGSNAGRAYLYSGRDHALLLTHDGAAWDQLGASVSAAGDLDGDGGADLWIGAPFSDSGGFNSGSAYARSGSSGVLLFALHGSAPGDQLGFDVQPAGDVDADGNLDLLACAPAADTGGFDSGAAIVVAASSGSSLATLPGWSAGIYASAVAGAGDIDGDGRADVLLGAAGAHGSDPQSGAVRCFSGASGSELFTIDGVASRDWFGASVACVGDIDGDGQLDFAVGAPGHDEDLAGRGYVRVYSGADF